MKKIWKFIRDSNEELTWLVSLSQLVIATVIALVALVNYSKSVRGGQVSTTMKFVDKEEGESLQKANKRLETFWQELEIQEWAESLKAEANIAKRKTRYAEEFPQRVLETRRNSFGIVLRYYQKAAICSRSGVCDREMMCEFLFSGLQAFRESWGPLLNEKDAKFYSSVEEIGYFAEQACADRFQIYCDKARSSPYCT